MPQFLNIKKLQIKNDSGQIFFQDVFLKLIQFGYIVQASHTEETIYAHDKAVFLGSFQKGKHMNKL